MAITLLITDGNLIPVGDPLEDWSGLTATPTFNTAGTGTVSIPATPEVVEQLGVDRARLVVIRDGEYFMGGPIEQPEFGWSADGGGTGGSSDESDPGLLTINFTDDFAWIANEVAYPDPAHDAEHQTAANFTRTAANAEDVIRDLVDFNVGPSAIASRQIPHLVLGGASLVGTNVSLTTRFEPLGAVVRRMAIAGGGLGIRTAQVGDDIVVTVYQPVDLTSEVVFSRGQSNLRLIRYSPSAPTCNVALVGGDGTGLSRTIRERNDPASILRHGRIVKWINQSDTSDTTVMDQAGDQALADGAETAQVAFTAVDSDINQYGVNYSLGDAVTVEVWPGLEISLVVRAVTLTADPDTGEVLTPLIGSDAAITDSRILRELRIIAARVGLLERS